MVANSGSISYSHFITFGEDATKTIGVVESMAKSFYVTVSRNCTASALSVYGSMALQSIRLFADGGGFCSDPSTISNGTAHQIRLYTASTGGSEVSGNGYARQTSPFVEGALDANNTQQINFPSATSSWGTVYIRVYTSGGTLLCYWATGVSVAAGVKLRILAGQLVAVYP
jgi:hypothetical protein